MITGDSYQTIAISFQSDHFTEIERIVIKIFNIIILKLKERCIKSPQKEDWKQIADQFWEILNFPNRIGALDGNRVVIEAPSNIITL